jgi:uncharacterized glyoxalase superfamily protein PhnB
MSVHFQPKGFHTITPYLVVSDVRGVMSFMKAAFNAEQIECMEMPDGTVAHAEMKVGDSIVMIGAQRPGKPVWNAMLYLYVPDADATNKQALAAGATNVQEPADQFYGDRSGGVADTFGNQWWMATHKETVSPEELAKRMQAMRG